MNKQKQSKLYGFQKMSPSHAVNGQFCVDNKKINQNNIINISLQQYQGLQQKNSSSNLDNNSEDFIMKRPMHTHKREQMLQQGRDIMTVGHEIKSFISQSQQSLRRKLHPQNSSKKKEKINNRYQFKPPAWIKSRKKEPNNNVVSTNKNQYLNKNQNNQKIQQTLTSNDTDCSRLLVLGGSNGFEPQNTHHKYQVKKNKQPVYSQVNSHQESVVFQKSLGKKKDGIKNCHNTRQIELQNIKILQEIKKQKFEIQNLEEDKNIVLGVIRTLQTELKSKQRIIVEQTIKQQQHRIIQMKLRQKIEDLQNKLTQAKDQIHSKNELLCPEFNQCYTNTLGNDRQVIQRKNEQISRLNQIINKNRVKLSQIYQQLTQERINSHQNIKILEQRNQQLENTLKMKQNQIYQLQKALSNRRLDENSIFFRHTHANGYNNPGFYRFFNNFHSNLNAESRKSGQQQIKKVVSLNSLHKQESNKKIRNQYL